MSRRIQNTFQIFSTSVVLNCPYRKYFPYKDGQYGKPFWICNSKEKRAEEVGVLKILLPNRAPKKKGESSSIDDMWFLIKVINDVVVLLIAQHKTKLPSAAKFVNKRISDLREKKTQVT